jgi:hypothetical protein
MASTRSVFDTFPGGIPFPFGPNDFLLSTSVDELRKSTAARDAARAEKSVDDWKDLPIEKKIERTREQVKSEARRISAQADELAHLRSQIEALRHHSHDTDGDVVVQISLDEAAAQAKGPEPFKPPVSESYF